jgi:hypothetical protein
MLGNFLRYDADLDITIDTDEESTGALVAEVNRIAPSHTWPKGKTIGIRKWSHAELRRLWLANVARNDEGGTVSMLLAMAHRQYMHQRVHDYDYFMYIEDDLPLSADQFKLYLSRYRELWDKNWLFGFYRVEKTPSGE